jgi:hypothetical protein
MTVVGAAVASMALVCSTVVGLRFEGGMEQCNGGKASFCADSTSTARVPQRDNTLGIPKTHNTRVQEKREAPA